MPSRSGIRRSRITTSGSSSAIARSAALAAVGLAEQLEAVARLDGARHPGAEDAAVVDDEYADRAGALRDPSDRRIDANEPSRSRGAGLPPVADARDERSSRGWRCPYEAP